MRFKLIPGMGIKIGYHFSFSHAERSLYLGIILRFTVEWKRSEHSLSESVNGNKQGKLQGDSIGTKTAQLFVLDLIYALLVQAEREKAIKTKEKTLNVILEQRIKY